MMVLSLLRAPRVLVAGLGDLAWGDEGIGVHLARSLRGTLDGVDIVETSPPCDLFLEAFHDYDAIIAIDSVHWSNEIGRVLVLSPYALADFKGKLSSCEQALEEILSASEETGRHVPHIDIVGVCISEQESSRDGLSPTLIAKYDAILAEVRRVVTDLVLRARESSAWPASHHG